MVRPSLHERHRVGGRLGGRVSAGRRGQSRSRSWQRAIHRMPPSQLPFLEVRKGHHQATRRHDGPERPVLIRQSSAEDVRPVVGVCAEVPTVDPLYLAGVVWLHAPMSAYSYLSDPSRRGEVIHEHRDFGAVHERDGKRRIRSAREPEAALGEEEPEAAEHRNTRRAYGSDLSGTKRLGKERCDIERRAPAQVGQWLRHSGPREKPARLSCRTGAS